MYTPGGAITHLPLLVLLLSADFWACILYYSMPSAVPTDVTAFLAPASTNDDPCTGRYVYIHELPPRFNADILAGCDKDEGRWPRMCEHVSNAGLGPPLLPLEGEGEAVALTGATGWYATPQFSLDAIFHGRMRRYECLTNDSSAAAAVFVPFYAGFEFTLHNWGYDNETRDAASVDLARWLTGRPEWRRAGGRDHFLVAGRTAWDFQRGRGYTHNPEWGTKLLLLDAGMNMTVLVVESSTASLGNDMTVPYPTYFHPRTDAHVLDWQARIKSSNRPWLMSFVGAPRPEDLGNVRAQIIDQCNQWRSQELN